MLPTGRPLYFAPCACAASSITTRPWLPRDFHDRVHVRRLTVEMHRQNRFGARRDRRLNRARIHGERARDRYRPGRAALRYRRLAATLATNVNGTVMTSSPGPTPAASKAKCRALVPEFKAIHSAGAAIGRRIPVQTPATSEPRMNWPLSRTLAMAASISGLMLRYCAFKSREGTLMFAMNIHKNPVSRRLCSPAFATTGKFVPLRRDVAAGVCTSDNYCRRYT